jgi:hypothetical protein
MNVEPKRLEDGKWSGSVTKTGRTAWIPSTKVLNLARMVAVREECNVFAAVSMSLKATSRAVKTIGVTGPKRKPIFREQRKCAHAASVVGKRRQ